MGYPEWHEEALCQEYPIEWFFGGDELPGKRRHRPTLTAKEARRAKEICRQCPVLNECYEWAMKHQEPAGIWGATTPRERQRAWQRQYKDC